MQTIATNIHINASSQFTNYDFNSMFVFNGKLWGCGENGLRILNTGSNDAGTDIDAYFTLLKSGLEVDGEKRIRFIHCNYSSDGNIAASVELDDDVTSADIEFVTDTNKGYQTRRIEPPRSLGWFSNCALTVKNVNGSSMSIKSIDVEFYKRGFTGK